VLGLVMRLMDEHWYISRRELTKLTQEATNNNLVQATRLGVRIVLKSGSWSWCIFETLDAATLLDIVR